MKIGVLREQNLIPQIIIYLNRTTKKILINVLIAGPGLQSFIVSLEL